MKFTKQQRHEIYKELLEKVDEPIWGNYFTCWKLFDKLGGTENQWSELCAKHGWRSNTEMKLIYSEYPEFKRVLEHMSDGCALEQEQRPICLKRCIELSKP
jgi:hypothetical protein